MIPLTLPGSIPGLLRPRSPILYRGMTGSISAIAAERVTFALDDSVGVPLTRDVEDLSLDLSDPTGRAHAAWWVLRHAPSGVLPDSECLLIAARAGDDMTPTQIETLRALVLRLAGVAP